MPAKPDVFNDRLEALFSRDIDTISPGRSQIARNIFAPFSLRFRERIKGKAQDNRIGPIEETLKWGEPSYLTSKTKSGTTIRLAWKAKHPELCGIYFNCQTSLVNTFRTLFPELRYEGNRAILLDAAEEIPESALNQCLEMALVYHKAKRKKK